MAVALGPGLSFAAVLTEGGGLWVWGRKQYGVLGLGHGEEVWGETLLSPELLGGAGVPATGDGGGDTGALAHAFGHELLVMVSAGEFHAAAVTDAGGVWVWGADFPPEPGATPHEDGQGNFRNVPVRWDSAVCGRSPVVMVACGRCCTLALTCAGHVWDHGCDWREEAAPAEPVRVAGLQRITMVAAGERACFAVAADGRLWSWGSRAECPDDNDELLQDATFEEQNTPRVLPLAAFGGSAVLFVAACCTHGALVTDAGELWVWGTDSTGCTGLGISPQTPQTFRKPRRVGAPDAPQFAGARVLMAACGWGHMVVLTDGGAVWTCGMGSYGALGHQTQDYFPEPRRIPQCYFRGRPVACVAAARTSSMAVTARGVLYSWGTRAHGHGDETTRFVPTVVAATGPPGCRVGRTCAVPREHMLAFCLGTHLRLGDNGCAYAHASADAVSRIGEAAQGLRGAYLHMGEGLLRLLGVRLRVPD